MPSRPPIRCVTAMLMRSATRLGCCQNRIENVCITCVIIIVLVAADWSAAAVGYDTEEDCQTNTGSVDAQPCTLNAGKATCSTTVTWTSSSPSACIYLQPSGQLFACSQSGSKVVSWISATPKDFVLHESRSPASLQLGSAVGVRALQAQ